MTSRTAEQPGLPTVPPGIRNPPWTVRSVLAAAVLTIATYLLLPYLELLSNRPEPSATLRGVSTLDTPLPPPPPARARS